MYKQLDGIIVRNCPLGDDMLKSAILNLSTALSIRLLVLHTCGLTDELAGVLGQYLLHTRMQEITGYGSYV